MVAIERLSHRAAKHTSFHRNETVLFATYRVKGQKNELEIIMYLGDPPCDEEKAIDVFLKRCDENAQWAADHPDQIATLKPELVIVE